MVFESSSQLYYIKKDEKKTAQNRKNLRLNDHTSFEFQTRN